MDRDMNILYILGVPLGYVMEWIYNLIPNYGWDIIIFTIVIRLLSIPLQLNQQKSMAKMSAFQPMIADIQKKYKDKPDKQQEELMKLQQNYGYKPTAGCMPMLVNFLVMFGVIEVVYLSLIHILPFPFSLLFRYFVTICKKQICLDVFLICRLPAAEVSPKTVRLLIPASSPCAV